MVDCLQKFLKNGLIKQNAKNIKMRKFIAESSMEFYEWIHEPDNCLRNERIDKQVAFNNFVNEYKDFQKYLTRKKFNIWVQKYCKFIDVEYLSGNSNGLQWFTIKTRELDKINEVDF